MVDLFKRMFGKDASLTTAPPLAASAATEAATPHQSDEARLAARRAQIANDLFELQQIAMAELELRKEQDAAAAKAGFEADENGLAGRALII